MYSFDCINNLRIKFLVQRKGPEKLKEAHPERPSKEKSRGIERRPTSM
jgi:hypothetical protein